MENQNQVTEEQFVLAQRMESLARQNAQQALRIADLEAQIALVQAKAQQLNQNQKSQTQNPLTENSSNTKPAW